MKKTVLFCVLIACAALVGGAFILQKPFVQLRNAGGITVKGTAVRKVVSNAATWEGRIEVRSFMDGRTDEQTLKEGYEKIELQTKIARECLLKQGATPESLEIGAPAISPIYEYVDGRSTGIVRGYQFVASLYDHSTDVDNVRQLAHNASELIRRGVEFTSGNPNFYYTKLENLKVQLLQEASSNARLRAHALISGSGCVLGGVVSASQGVFQITEPLSTDVSDWGCYDTRSVEKEVKCVVTVTYAVK